MHHPLISTIVIALALAWALGAVAHRLKLPPLIGYLAAGVLIGPATPGFVADQKLANELAEIGVILLMFGVGLHFSLKDLMSVRAIAVPGAVVQIASATILGVGLAHWLGWSLPAGLVFGLALSVASTVVLLRALQERRLVETERGRIAVGWLIVEDIVMIVTLVLLPPLTSLLLAEAGTAAPISEVAEATAITLAKIAAFVAVMLVIGKRTIPWLLHYMAHTGSRELFRLSVLVIALGTAFAAAELFGVSFALGAFFAGMVMAESTLSEQAARETIPLRDAFAVIFFVSVGMLFNPAILVEAPLAVLATVLIILLGKSLAAFLIIRAFGYSNSTATLVSVSLAQIGEFSFILAGLGVTLGVLPEEGRSLILAGALISIFVNPFLFTGLDMLSARRGKPVGSAEPPAAPPKEVPREPLVPTSLSKHMVLVGHGRVGSEVSAALMTKATPLLVISEHEEAIASLREKGVESIIGNAADPDVLSAANLREARGLLVTIPDAFEGGQVVEQARAANPHLLILARAHSGEEVEHLVRHGASSVILGESEIAKAMVKEVEAAGRNPAPGDGETTARNARAKAKNRAEG